MARVDGRRPDQMRALRMTPGFFQFAEGSVLVEMGHTRVACAVSVEEKVPPWMVGRGSGWVTAEYAMLPRSTPTRNARESGRGGPTGRTMEIQRLIGRALRPTINLKALGERTLTVDCDVLGADGGTRTAAITGSYVALRLATDALVKSGKLPRSPIRTAVAAISVGVVQGEALLDLCYTEDSRAEVDANVVMTAQGEFVEVQSTAEGKPFSMATLTDLLTLARDGIDQLLTAQQECLRG